ncbi:MAG: cytidylyltransferase domain-containing protein, partial [Planctomycetaceae bacterium]
VACPILSPAVLRDPSCVKLVTNALGHAMYFSRSQIPFTRDSAPEQFFREGETSPFLLHVGLYGYRREFLLRLTSLPPSPLEQMEKLEQLRALQAGARIAVAVVNHAAVGIDTPADYEAFVLRQQTPPIRRAA